MKPEHPSKPADSKAQERHAAQSAQSEQLEAVPQTQAAHQAAEYKEALARLQADFENYRKRAERENEHVRKYAAAQIIKQLLPVLDSFEMAFKNTADKDKFVKGVELIYAQLHSLLEEQGLKPIAAKGKPFDPFLEEVLLQEESEQDGIVLEELQKGYLLNDAVLRYAKVKIGKKKEEDQKEGDQKEGRK